MKVSTVTTEGIIDLSLSNQKGVYFIHSDHFGFIKIGCSSSIADRIRSIQEGFPEALHLVGVLLADDYRKAEQWFHWRFSRHRVLYEWFNVDALEIRRAATEYEQVNSASEWLRIKTPLRLTLQIGNGFRPMRRKKTVDKHADLRARLMEG